MGRRLVEADLILSAILPEDPLREVSRETLYSLGGAALSPYALVELDLLVRSGRLGVRDEGTFFSALGNLLGLAGLRPLPPEPRYHARAAGLRSEYPELTFFDSLHAAVAMEGGYRIVSYDRVYDAVEGLERVDPRSLVQGVKGPPPQR